MKNNIILAGLLALAPSFASAATINLVSRCLDSAYGCPAMGLNEGETATGRITLGRETLGGGSTQYVVVQDFFFDFPTMTVSSDSDWGYERRETYRDNNSNIFASLGWVIGESYSFDLQSDDWKNPFMVSGTFSAPGMGTAFVEGAPAPIPLPAAAWLLIGGLGGLGWLSWRRQS